MVHCSLLEKLSSFGLEVITFSFFPLCSDFSLAALFVVYTLLLPE